MHKKARKLKSLAASHGPVFVLASSQPVIKRGEMANFRCACHTRFMAYAGKAQPFCVVCGSEDVEQVGEDSDFQFPRDDENVASVQCPSCYTTNIMMASVATALAGKLHCVTCGEGVNYIPPEIPNQYDYEDTSPFENSEYEDDGLLSMADLENSDEDEDDGIPEDDSDLEEAAVRVFASLDTGLDENEDEDEDDGIPEDDSDLEEAAVRVFASLDTGLDEDLSYEDLDADEPALSDFDDEDDYDENSEEADFDDEDDYDENSEEADLDEDSGGEDFEDSEEADFDDEDDYDENSEEADLDEDSGGEDFEDSEEADLDEDSGGEDFEDSEEADFDDEDDYDENSEEADFDDEDDYDENSEEADFDDEDDYDENSEEADFDDEDADDGEIDEDYSDDTDTADLDDEDSDLNIMENSEEADPIDLEGFDDLNLNETSDLADLDEDADDEDADGSETASICLVNTVKGQLTFEAAGNKLTAYIRETPVATLTREEAGENAGVLSSETFAQAIAHTAQTMGAVRALEHFGFKLIKAKLPVTAFVNNKVSENTRKALSKIRKNNRGFQKKLAHAMQIASAGINKSFFKDSRNPIKEALYAEMQAAGISNPARIIDKVFASKGDAYHKELFAKATELMKKPHEIRNQLAEAIGDSNYQSADEGDEECSEDSQDLNSTLENAGIRSVDHTSMKIRNNSEMNTASTEAVAYLKSGSLF